MTAEIEITFELINLDLTESDYTTIFIKKLDRLPDRKTMTLRQQLATEQQKILHLEKELAYKEHKLKKKTHHWDRRHQSMRGFDATRRGFDAIIHPNTSHPVKNEY